MNNSSRIPSSLLPSGRSGSRQHSLVLKSIPLLALLLFFAPGMRIAQASDFPTVLWSLHDAGKAAWVTPERATLYQGQIDWTLFGDLQSAVLRRAIERHQGSDCVAIGPLRKQMIGSGIANNLDDLVRNSFGVFRGTIEGRDVGFADGDPATLLQIRIEKIIKKSSEFSVREVGDVLYAAYPVAVVQLKNQRICKSDDRLPADVPEIGDKVIVFPMTGPLNEGRNMMYLYGQELFVERSNSTLEMPKRWRSDARISKAARLADIESMIKGNLPSAGEPKRED